MANQQSQAGKASAQSKSDSISAAEIQKFIGGIDFPCDKDELMEHAKEKGAPQSVLKLMEKFPDKEYHSVVDVSKDISQVKQVKH